MSHQVTVDINDAIYDGVEQFSQARGLAIEEGVKWLLGDFVVNNVNRYAGQSGYYFPAPVSPLRTVPAAPTPATPADKYLNLIKFSIQQDIDKNNRVCTNCQSPLTVKAVEDNECEKCHQKII